MHFARGSRGTLGCRNMTKAEALAILRGNGFHTFERDWAIGQTIEVASEPSAGDDGIVVYRRVVHLVREQDSWIVEESRLVPAESYRSEPLTLEQACEHVNSILSGPRGSS